MTATPRAPREPQTDVTTTDQRLAAELAESGLDEHQQAEAMDAMLAAMDEMGCS